jgi:hypothetical protein
LATVEAHQDRSTGVDVLLGRRVRYQKHKPGRHLSVDRMPQGTFRIESVNRFGERIVLNDGIVVMESAPTVIERGGRIALLLATGEELYFFVE